MTKFRRGDTVVWESQAQGNRMRKVGRVVAVVPANTDPVWVKGPGSEDVAKLDGPGMSRAHESYVVRVKGRGVFWPRVSGLRLATETEIEKGCVRAW